MPASRLSEGIRFSLLGVVIRYGLIADGIDLTAHLEWSSSAVRKGEIHCGTCAVRRRGTGIRTRRSPEPGHIALNLFKSCSHQRV